MRLSGIEDKIDKLTSFIFYIEYHMKEVKKVIILSRTELSNKYNISKNTWDRRKDELLEYLNEYMDIKEEIQGNGRYVYYIDEDTLPESIPKIPRKNDRAGRALKYIDYTIAALGTEFKPNSKSKIAREAINDFAFKEYGHKSQRSVVKTYVGPIMEEKGEKSSDMIWVNSVTYEPLTDEEVALLNQCFKDARITEKEMANAFIKYQQEEDITDESNRYNKAIMQFSEYNNCARPIKVYKWRAKI